MISITSFISVLLYLATFVESNDVMIGHATPFSKKIYSAIKEADPALWTRRDDIMVNAPYHDYICAVYITDLRPDKEGEAYIEAGGIGSKTVTISLKSPSVLRGYKFAIEVYAESIFQYLSNSRGLSGNVGNGGYSGYNSYGNYPSTLSISRVSYPIGNGYSGVYPQAQYPIGR